MTTQTIVPANLTRQDLVAKAGSNVPPERVKFEGSIFDLTLAYASDPMEALKAATEAVMSTFEAVERTEMFEGYTADELANALDVVLNNSADGVPQVISTGPNDGPSTRRIPVGYDFATGQMRHRIVPKGAMSLPGFRNLEPKQKAWIRVIPTDEGAALVSKTIRGDQGALEGIFAYVREYANAKSIYLGQVVDIEFQYMNITSFVPEHVALTDKARKAVNLWVRQPFINRDRLGAFHQSPKTGLLFEGPPGGGKTMTVKLCEFIAANSGGVVIHVDPATGVGGLTRADNMAKRLLNAGHTVMIVFEDMEKLALQNRARVLEILDGSESKGQSRIIVGTTNFVEQMDNAMLRPGRFDSIIHCGLPDLSAFTQLVNVLVDEEHRGDIDYAEAFPYFEGYSYATITNAVSIVIRSAIANTEAFDLDGDIKVTTEDLITAAEMVRDHHELINKEPVVEVPKLEQAFRAALEQDFSALEDHVSVETCKDNTDYDIIGEVVSERTDNVLEYRLDSATIEDSKGGEGRLRTN